MGDVNMAHSPYGRCPCGTFPIWEIPMRHMPTWDMPMWHIWKAQMAHVAALKAPDSGFAKKCKNKLAKTWLVCGSKTRHFDHWVLQSGSYGLPDQKNMFFGPKTGPVNSRSTPLGACYVRPHIIQDYFTRLLLCTTILLDYCYARLFYYIILLDYCYARLFY